MVPKADIAAWLGEAEELLARRAYRDAHALCLKVLAEDSLNARAHFLLGVLTADHRNHVKAVELFERAIAADGSKARYHAHLAKSLTATRRHLEARVAADRAANLQPTDALTLDTIGVVYSRLGLHEIAIGFFERATGRDGRNANYFYNMGASLQFLGKFDEAGTCYRRAIELDATFSKPRSALVQLSKQTKETNQIDSLTALFEAAGEDADQRLHLGHAIAKSYEDLGEHAASLAWLFKAKELKKATLRYSIDADRKLFAAAAATVDKPAAGHPSEAPIFIVGLPRTGTTLVDRILSSHSNVVSAGESTNFALLVKRLTNTPSNMVLDEATLAKANTLDFERLGGDYVAATQPSEGRKAPHFIDKMPLNFLYAGLIIRALPNARIICLRRHPMDSCLSNFRQLFSTNYPYYDYSYDLESTAEYYALFDGLVGHWRRMLPANRFTEVSYEALVSSQEAETRRLLQFCGLGWEAACLDFHRNEAPVSTASSVQVRQPLYATSVGRWKRYGAALQPLIDALESNGIHLE